MRRYDIKNKDIRRRTNIIYNKAVQYRYLQILEESDIHQIMYYKAEDPKLHGQTIFDN